MRRGKYVVKRLMSVLLGASLAMGAPGSALVSVASEAEGMESAELFDGETDLNREESESDETATGENESQAGKNETQAECFGEQTDNFKEEEIQKFENLENPESDEKTADEENADNTAETPDQGIEENAETTSDVDNSEVPSSDASADNMEDTSAVKESENKDDPETADATDEDAESKKQAAKDKQKHEKENINNSASVNRESIHDGTILHAFCWSFNTIKENMQAIADAGFTAIQTSPANACLDTHPALSLRGDLNGTDGMWYYHYQPTDWTLGNYQLGTRQEFMEMCNEADKYGIGIIVDILPNHTTPTDEAISQNMIDAVGGWDNLFHKDYKAGMDYNNRGSVTYNAMGGLYDVDTENTDFQDYFYAYLNDCINCGADGFRIDTAKHIALPDDPVPSNYSEDAGRNNFYPNMAAAIDAYSEETGNGKNYSNLFVYGEVLQGDGDRLAAYQQYIGGTTASNYGGTIRSAIAGNNVSAGKLSGYGIYDETNYKADSNRLVTWVESHDNYINDESYKTLDDKDTIEAWAVIAARKDGTPLFFSRPRGSSAENPFGDNIIGITGNDLFKSPEVTAVNKFRTSMKGKGETLSNPGGDVHVLMIERGDEKAEGAVLVNTASYPVAISGETTLADGNYVNTVEGKTDLFSVKEGKIDGIIQQESVVVLTKATDEAYTAVHFNNSNNWKNVLAYIDDNETPVIALSENDGWFRINVASENFKIAFTDGNEKTAFYDIEGGKESFVTPEKTDVFESKKDADTALGLVTDSVYFFNTELWGATNIYSWFDDPFVPVTGEWPGKNTYDDGGYWIRADLKLPKERADDKYNVIFNTEGTQTANISVTGDKKYIVLNGKNDQGQWNVLQFASKAEAEDALGISANSTTVYFYNKNEWDEVYAYTWEAYSFGEWPGTACENEGEGWWKVTVPAAAGANFKIIFNNNNNGKQTGDLVIRDIKNRFVVGNRIYGSKEEALNPPDEEDFVVTPAYPEGTPVTRIYYYDDNDWGRVDAYIWGGVENKYNDALGKWPGTRMYSEKNGWYYTDVPTEAMEGGSLHLILNNMGSGQLEDKIIDDTTNVFFNTTKTIGYGSKELAIEGKDKTEEPGKEDPEEPGKEDPEEPGTEEPGKENPEQPGTEEPGKEEPEQPGTEEPGKEEPEQPGTEEPAKENPGTPVKEETKETVNTKPEGTATTPDTPSKEEKEKPSVTVPETTPAKVETEKAVSVTGVKLDKHKVKIGKTGTYKLTADILPADATDKEVTWSSSDNSIAEVSAEGLIKAKKKGSCIITVTTKDGGFKDDCKVTVTKKVKVEGVKLNKSKKTLTEGKTFALKATLKPKKATISDVKWSSSDKNVATVDENGVVTAVSKGTATITVTTVEGNYKATCKISVKKPKTKKIKKTNTQKVKKAKKK
ncbi:starch-binding protein [Butyrivibrio sp. AE3004]|uniref:starch-binding protein n=1 Tax=Butyrivibrio sp. AE3004 TaxID=1506994 RepID=UPI00068FE2B5|nr:starch-binding protein [Butyrivibrio sp. AE3004]